MLTFKYVWRIIGGWCDIGIFDGAEDDPTHWVIGI